MPRLMQGDGALEDERGVGEPSTKSGRPRIADINMVERALSSGWITPDEAEELAPQRMLEILKRKSPRGWVAAAKLLDTMKRTRLAAIDVAIRAEQHELGKQIVAEARNVEKCVVGPCEEVRDIAGPEADGFDEGRDLAPGEGS